MSEKETVYDYEALQNQLRRNSEIEMLKALESKKDELAKYKMKLIFRKKNETPNRLLESYHSTTIENKILNFFIFIFSLFIFLQFSLIGIIKFDINFQYNYNYYEKSYQIIWLCVLIIGKLLSYFCLLNFLIRCYIGIKIFNSTVKTNILIKLLNYQFMGFFKTTLITIGIIGVDMMMRQYLVDTLNYLNNDYYNHLVENIKLVTKFIDFVVYSILGVGIVMSVLWRMTRYMVTSK